MSEQDIERQWRAASTETPGERIDAAIRAAARRNMQRRPAWSRYVPLAAAASVGVVAILLVRQSPHEDLTRVAPITAPVVTEESVAEDAVAPAVPDAPTAPAASQRAPASPAAAERKTAPPVPDAFPARATPDAGVARAEAEQRSIAAMARAPAPAAAAADSAEVAADATAGTHANGEAQLLPARLVELITADAAAVADVDPQDVEIVSWEAITWSDGSLGCRTRGEMAIQVLTPGYRVQVLAGGQSLVYHTDRRDLVRLCRQPGAPVAR